MTRDRWTSPELPIEVEEFLSWTWSPSAAGQRNTLSAYERDLRAYVTGSGAKSIRADV
jgi:hypothetical protein